MVSLMSLWLPILLSAVLVFAASSVIHMMLTYHRSDFRKVPAEDDVMEALRRFKIPAGDYVMPCAGSPKEMGTPEFMEKAKNGPVAFVTVLPGGSFSTSQSLVQWFIYCVGVGVIVGYVAGLALAPGAEYRVVFRIVSTVAFAAYSMALLQGSIWYKHGWGFTLKTMLDGLVYALLTGGTFGWLWPA